MNCIEVMSMTVKTDGRYSTSDCFFPRLPTNGSVINTLVCSMTLSRLLVVRHY